MEQRRTDIAERREKREADAQKLAEQRERREANAQELALTEARRREKREAETNRWDKIEKAQQALSSPNETVRKLAQIELDKLLAEAEQAATIN